MSQPRTHTESNHEHRATDATVSERTRDGRTAADAADATHLANDLALAG